MRRSLEVALSQLNSEQREAATERGHCLVMACPGSGKTRTLAVKAALLLDSEPLARTCIVTFTKDGASELKRRTIDILDGDAASGNRLIAGTFHGLCYRMLSKVRKINLKNIVSDAEQFHYAERALAEVKIFDVDKHAALSLIEHARSLPHLADARAKLLADVYLDIMRRNGKLDFSDLVIDTIAGLESGAIPPIPAAYMLIDEFQDTDWLQYRWARQHSANGTKITVVGDDDQAIFGWRFAMGYEGMMTFADDHDAHRVVLGHNYRCRSEILDAAGRVIVYNINRVPKTLVAAKGPGGSVGCDEYATIADEALAILDAFRDFASEDYSAAVIGRTNRSLKTIEAVLKPAGIPCTITRSASLFRAIETHVYRFEGAIGATDDCG